MTTNVWELPVYFFFGHEVNSFSLPVVKNKGIRSISKRKAFMLLINMWGKVAGKSPRNILTIDVFYYPKYSDEGLNTRVLNVKY